MAATTTWQMLRSLSSKLCLSLKILTVGISQSGGSKQSKWYTKGQKSQETEGTPRLVLPQTAQFLGKVSLPSLLSSFHFQLKGRFSWGCSSWGSLNSSAFVTYKGKNIYWYFVSWEHQCWTVGAIFTFGRSQMFGHSRMFGHEKLRSLAVGRSRSRRIKKCKNNVIKVLISNHSN